MLFIHKVHYFLINIIKTAGEKVLKAFPLMISHYDEAFYKLDTHGECWVMQINEQIEMEKYYVVLEYFTLLEMHFVLRSRRVFECSMV